MSATRTAPTGFVRRMASLAAPFTAGALATLGAFLLFRDSFPEKVATHFTLDGTADDYRSPAAAFGLYMLVFALEAFGAVAAGFSARSITANRSLRVFSYGLAAATAYLFIAIMWTNSSEGHTPHLPLHHLPVAVALGAAAGAVAWLIARRPA